MSSSTSRARILRVLNTAPEGLTCKQVERMTGVRHSTASAALSWLADKGLVHRLSGFRKPYHWVTSENLRGRAVIEKPRSRKDLLIDELYRRIYVLTTPQDSATLSPEQDRTEREHSGTHA